MIAHKDEGKSKIKKKIKTRGNNWKMKANKKER